MNMPFRIFLCASLLILYSCSTVPQKKIELRKYHFTKETIKFNTPEGKNFNADYYRSSRQLSGAIIILPGLSGQRSFYKDFAKFLAESGFNVLSTNYHTIDKPRHKIPLKKRLLKLNKRGGVDTIINEEGESIVRFIKNQVNVNPKMIHIIGGSMGSWVGFVLMARHPDLKSLTILSPSAVFVLKSKTEEWFDITKKFGKRHLFFVASEKDIDKAFRTSGTDKISLITNELPEANVDSKIYQQKAHSFQMLQRDKNLKYQILKWLETIE